jgi:transcriptional regulator with XRE-family HTH domain
MTPATGTRAGSPGGPADARIAPGLCRRRVGDAVRRARENRSLTQREAAGILEWSLSKLIRIEAGRCSVSVTDLQAMLRLYQAETQTSALAAQARIGRQRPWYARYPAATAVPGLAAYLDAETSAATIRGCQVIGLPDLLQTPDYARAFRDEPGQPPPDEWQDLLAARQLILDHDSGPDIRYLLDEATLHRGCGGPAVMHAQLRRLAELADHPRISIRVVPFEARAGTATGPVTIFGYTGEDTSEVYAATADGVARRPDGEAGHYLERFATSWWHAADIRASGLLAPPAPARRRSVPGTQDQAGADHTADSTRPAAGVHAAGAPGGDDQ